MDNYNINRPFATDSTTDELCLFLAGRLRAHRLRQNLTQAEVAESAGLALRTYRRLEATGRGSIESLIEILRVFGRVASVAIMFPEPQSVALKRPQDRIRKYAYSPRPKRKGTPIP